MSDSASQVPFGDALTEAVRGLRGQPPLLAAVAIAIVLAAVAVAAGDVVRAITIPLLALLGAGLLAWVYTDTRRVQKKRPGVFKNTRFGAWSRQDDLTIRHGDVAVQGGTRVEENLRTGIGSHQEGVTIEHGSVTER